MVCVLFYVITREKEEEESRMNRFKKFGIRSVTMLTSLALLIPSINVYAASRDTRLISQVEHTDLKFEDFEYVEMKESDFDAIIADLPDIVDDTSKADEVLEIIIAMEDYYNDLEGNGAIAHIYSDLDADNEEYDEWVQNNSDLSTSVIDKINIAYNLIALSNNSDVLHDRIDDDDEWQDILNYEPMTDEQKEWDSLETELSLKYDTIYNEVLTYEIDGVEYTKDELTEAVGTGEISYLDFLEGYYEISKIQNEELAELYIQLVEVRTNIARSYGYDNYAEYAYDKIYDREYTPEGLADYKDQVKTYYSPLLEEVYDEYRSYQSDISEMFDVAITVDDAMEMFESHLADVSDDMLESYTYMVEHNLINIEQSDKKAPGGYTISISGQFNAPFMYNCASGDFTDFNTLVHEFGHYNEMYFAPYEEWYYGGCNLDLAEIHSQGLELIYDEWADEFYGDYAEAMRMYALLNNVYIIVEGCKEDEFQYQVYTNPDNLTVERLNQIYYDVCEEYGDADLYDSPFLASMGYGEKDEMLEWVRIPHTFQSPMYYISYSVSMAGVEELRCELEEDRDEGIEKYLQLVAAGTDAEFSDTLASVGINNPIENPRFEYYAHNNRLIMGVDDGYRVDGSSQDIDDIDDDDDDVDDTDTDDSNKKKKKDKKDKKDKEPDEKVADKKDGIALPMTAIIAGCGVLGVILVVVIIVAIVSTSKKKKNKESEDIPQVFTQPTPPPVINQMPPKMPETVQNLADVKKEEEAKAEQSTKDDAGENK